MSPALKLGLLTLLLAVAVVLSLMTGASWISAAGLGRTYPP